MRARKGPALVHARVVRPYSHSLSDDEKLYKTPAEREAEARRDPIVRFSANSCARTASRPTPSSPTSPADVDREIERGDAHAALEAPKPAQGHGGALGLLAGCRPDAPPHSTRRAQPEGKPDTMVGAINRTLKDEMAREPAHRRLRRGRRGREPRRKPSNVVPGKGGVFKVTHGLQRLYGDDRVFNSPLAEAAHHRPRRSAWRRAGLKPVVEIQFFDYIWPAMMQLRDEMSMLRYRSGNTFSCPMVIRVADRRLPARRRAVPQPVGREHLRALPRASASSYPSTAVDAAGLLRTAIRCDDPVMFLEHKHLYRQTYNKGEYPGQGLHDPVREGRAPPARAPTS